MKDEEAEARAAVDRPRRILRFLPFECDLVREELRRDGRPVRLPPQPRRLLLALLEQPGEIVSRDALRERLWAADTFVDFEHGLNAAVKRLRAALGDDAEHPRYVETVPQRGYRFVASVHEMGRAEGEPTGARSSSSVSRSLRAAGVAAGLSALALALLARAAPTLPTVVDARRLTREGRVGFKVLGGGFAPVATDGQRLYFTERQPGGSLRAAFVPVAGGPPSPIPLPLTQPVVLGLKADGSELLLREAPHAGEPGPLWAISTTSLALRRLGAIAADDAAWSPDGQTLLFSQGRDLLRASGDGQGVERLATLSGAVTWPRFSPDGRRVRFTVTDQERQSRDLFEIGPHDREARRLFAETREWISTCCGEWTRDGRLFVFAASGGEHDDLWALGGGLAPDEAEAPRRLSVGPVGYLAAVPSPDGGRLFATGFDGRYEVLRYDAARGGLLAREGIAGAYSRARDRVAWSDKGGLFGSRPDGRERVQLAPSGTDILMVPEWSPDGTVVAFAGRERGQPYKLHVVAADGSGLRRLIEDERHEADPSWSPDGRRLMFGRPPDSLGGSGEEKAIHVFDLESGAVQLLPGSEGRYSPRWSPDGSHVAALSLRDNGLELFSFATREWRRIGSFPAHNPRWSADGRYVYFQAQEEEYRPLYRVRAGTGRLEAVVSPRDLAKPCWFMGLDHDDAPLLGCTAGGADLYQLQLGAPGKWWRPILSLAAAVVPRTDDPWARASGYSRISK